MEKGTKRTFTLKTKKGCWRLLACLLLAVMVCSFAAALVSSDFGRVKVSHVTIDVRGGALDADLYYPAGTSRHDKLPAVILAHGRGVAKGVMKGQAEELSRRGFVVFNVSAYGAGLSEQPPIDDSESEAFVFGSSPLGLTDAIHYVRTLQYVDATRIGMVGHSHGSGRAALAVVEDCGYLTLNDLLINVLCETFGQTFSPAEISMDADALAGGRLNADQLLLYEDMKARVTETYNTRLRTAVFTGSTGSPTVNDPVVVQVGGHDVSRPVQANITYVNGKFDSLGPGANWNTDGTAPYFGTQVQMESWYQAGTDGGDLRLLGGVYELSVADDAALMDAVDNRQARSVLYNSESHSKQYFSSATFSDVCKLLEQTLKYNRGNLSDSATVPLDVSNSIWFLRAVFNCIAMLAMLAMIFPLVGLFTKGDSFAACVAPLPAIKIAPPGKRVGLILGIMTVVFTFFTLFIANTGGPIWANPFGVRILPYILRLITTSMIGVWFVVGLGLCALIMVVVNVAISKKKTGKAGTEALNIRQKAGSIGKSLLMALLVLSIAYLLLTVIDYLFHQDFRFWQMGFTTMKIEYWLVALPYFLLFLPIYFVIGMSINYSVDREVAEWKSSLKTVLINSAGVWLCLLITVIHYYTAWQGAPFTDFTLSFSMVLYVPVSTYITRKLYLMTNSIWTGAFVNAAFLAWSLVSLTGIYDIYYGQGWLSVVFGL